MVQILKLKKLVKKRNLSIIKMVYEIHAGWFKTYSFLKCKLINHNQNMKKIDEFFINNLKKIKEPQIIEFGG